MKDELKPCPKCKENGAPARRVNDAGKYCVECVECYEASTPWFDDQRIAEGYWMAISDDATLNLMKITELKESESSLIERLNEQRRYTEQAVKENDRLYERISELESHVDDLFQENAEFEHKIGTLESKIKLKIDRIAELEEALLQAKVAMDYLGDILNNNDVVDAEQNDSAALNPLFVAVDNTINGIPNGWERRNEIEAAASERTKQPLDE